MGEIGQNDSKQVRIGEIGQTGSNWSEYQNGSKWVRIGEIGQNSSEQAKLVKWAKIGETGQNGSKQFKIGEIGNNLVTIGQNM